MNDVLVAILVDLMSSENYDATLVALTAKFGKPEVKVLTYQNGFGATFNKRVAIWKNAISSVAFSEMGPIDGKASLRISLNSFADEHYPSQAEKAKSALKDL